MSSKKPSDIIEISLDMISAKDFLKWLHVQQELDQTPEVVDDIVKALEEQCDD